MSLWKNYKNLESHENFGNQYVEMQWINENMIKLQTIALLFIIIGELISQNHYSSYSYIFNKHFFNEGIIKMKNTQ
jgi:hypothetical protein